MSLAARIKREKGVKNGVASFYEHLPQDFLEEKRQQRNGRPMLPAQVCFLAFSSALLSESHSAAAERSAKQVLQVMSRAPSQNLEMECLASASDTADVMQGLQ